MKDGNVEPIKVRQIGIDRYEIIYGLRRWLASRMAGKTEIQCIIIDADERECLIQSVLENMNHERLSTMDYIKGLNILHENGHSTTQIAQEVGKTQAWVVRELGLLKIDASVQQMIEPQGLSVKYPPLPLYDADYKLFIPLKNKKSLSATIAMLIQEKVKDPILQKIVADVVVKTKLSQVQVTELIESVKKLQGGETIEGFAVDVTPDTPIEQGVEYIASDLKRNVVRVEIKGHLYRELYRVCSGMDSVTMEQAALIHLSWALSINDDIWQQLFKLKAQDESLDELLRRIVSHYLENSGIGLQ